MNLHTQRAKEMKFLKNFMQFHLCNGLKLMFQNRKMTFCLRLQTVGITVYKRNETGLQVNRNDINVDCNNGYIMNAFAKSH